MSTVVSERDNSRIHFDQVRRHLGSSIPSVQPRFNLVGMNALVLTNEVTALYKFIDAQTTIGRDVTTMVAKQHLNVINKIRALQLLSAEDATNLNELFSVPIWTDTQQASLLDALSDQLLSWTGRAHQAARRAQRCHTLEDFFPQSLWTYLGSDPTADIQLKTHKLCTFTVRLGFTYPSEKIIGKLAAILAVIGLGNPNASIDTLNELARYVKTVLRSEASRQRYPLDYMVEYPLKPDGLPTDMYNHAYNEEPPVQCTTSQLIQQVAEQKFLRNSSTQLRNTPMRFASHAGGPYNYPPTSPAGSFSSPASESSTSLALRRPSLERAQSSQWDDRLQRIEQCLETLASATPRKSLPAPPEAVLPEVPIGARSVPPGAASYQSFRKRDGAWVPDVPPLVLAEQDRVSQMPRLGPQGGGNGDTINDTASPQRGGVGVGALAAVASKATDGDGGETPFEEMRRRAAEATLSAQLKAGVRGKGKGKKPTKKCGKGKGNGK
jgi:hypothetical protein